MTKRLPIIFESNAEQFKVICEQLDPIEMVGWSKLDEQGVQNVFLDWPRNRFVAVLKKEEPEELIDIRLRGD